MGTNWDSILLLGWHFCNSLLRLCIKSKLDCCFIFLAMDPAPPPCGWLGIFYTLHHLLCAIIPFNAEPRANLVLFHGPQDFVFRVYSPSKSDFCRRSPQQVMSHPGRDNHCEGVWHDTIYIVSVSIEIPQLLVENFCIPPCM